MWPYLCAVAGVVLGCLAVLFVVFMRELGWRAIRRCDLDAVPYERRESEQPEAA